MALHKRDPVSKNNWRYRLHDIIFEADSPAGKKFDIILLWAILLSVAAVILESVESLSRDYALIFNILEWVFTIIFTLEYVARLATVKRPWLYAKSFYGIIDLLSILPTYLGLFIGGPTSIRIVRILRLLRVFRVLKLIGFLKEARILRDALRASRDKIIVFFMAVMTLVVILGTLMYIIEDPEAGFTSIPRSIYWAVVTLTTVGYGDIYPVTPFGQAVSAMMMILGYAIIAVPTGIVGAEISKTKEIPTNSQSCPNCSREGHDDDSKYCKFCGHELNPEV